jgi:hypothetical protein
VVLLDLRNRAAASVTSSFLPLYFSSPGSAHFLPISLCPLGKGERPRVVGVAL